MNKQKVILIECFIFIVTIPVVYCGISFGLGDNFALSSNNSKYALLRGVTFGFILVLITLPFLLNEAKTIQRSGIILGITAQLLLFFGFAIYSSLGASV